MADSYRQPWGATTPGCVIFLLDQSDSMDRTFGSGRSGEGKMLKDEVATQLNKSLNEIGRRCIKDESVSPRVDVAVIGYGELVGGAIGGALAGRELISIVDLMEHPLRNDKREKEEMDDTGELFKYEVDFPIWVEAVSGNGTPMDTALEMAHQIAKKWIRSHRESFPPLVINITDGIPNRDPKPAAEALRKLRTNDGAVLLFNCHISPISEGECLYPGPGDSLPPDKYARGLFEMSSEIPAGMRNLAIKLGVKRNMKKGDRGFVFNTDASGVMKMIEFATVQAISPEDDPGYGD